MRDGQRNIVAGLVVLAAFMFYGFVLIYLRDFAPDKEAWIASYGAGKHFESRLAHAHGNLFALLNVVFGFLLLRLPLTGLRARWISWLLLLGLLMPIGILAEVLLGAPPALVLVGGLSMLAGTAWLGVAVARLHLSPASVGEVGS
ncbi:MAG: hypothetical protein KA180_07030 [Gemmatimonadales bacterium]|nr:hypothetical protein [Gemmatimonadales bacterium]MBP9198769.1 hypothetical protein [Gemmatimonadales bacterium]